MLETVKQHPYLSGGAALLVILIIVFSRGGGTASATDPNAGGDVAAANALQAAQLQAQTQIAGAQIAAQASAAHDSAQVQALQIAADQANHLADVAADVQKTQIAASQDIAQRQIQTINVNHQKDSVLQLQAIEYVSSNELAAAIHSGDNSVRLAQTYANAYQTVNQPQTNLGFSLGPLSFGGSF